MPGRESPVVDSEGVVVDALPSPLLLLMMTLLVTLMVALPLTL